MKPLPKSTKLKGLLLLVIGTFYSFAVFAQQYPFQKPELSSEYKIVNKKI